MLNLVDIVVMHALIGHVQLGGAWNTTEFTITCKRLVVTAEEEFQW